MASIILFYHSRIRLAINKPESLADSGEMEGVVGVWLYEITAALAWVCVSGDIQPQFEDGQATNTGMAKCLVRESALRNLILGNPPRLQAMGSRTGICWRVRGYRRAR